MSSLKGCLIYTLIALPVVPTLAALDGRPILGWSSWNTFKVGVTEDIVVSSAHTMVDSGLHTAGYEYILIDDGWTALNTPRDENGHIPVNTTKFPSGMRGLTSKVHDLGLKVGIYTSVSAVTCGGYMGSLHHEEIDARWFVDMGFDFVKYDTCGTDCPIHNGCIQNATQHMGTALRNESARLGRDVIFYLDHGNPINPQHLFNPANRYVTDENCLLKVAVKPEELVWVWAHDKPWGPDMFKSWFDRGDKWLSLLSNVHNQIRVAEWQHCGFIHSPDMPTCGQGAFTMAECRAEFALYSILGAPLVLGADIRNISDPVMRLFKNEEMLAITRDPDCVQGSLTDNTQGAGEVWVRPLSDGTFAAVLLNKGSAPQNISLIYNNDGRFNSFSPAHFPFAHIRDVFSSRDDGIIPDNVTYVVEPHDALLLRVTPASNPSALLA